MVTTVRSFSGFSVDDVDAALRFYRDTLGLPARGNAMGGLEIDLTEGSSVFLYPKGRLTSRRRTRCSTSSFRTSTMR